MIGKGAAPGFVLLAIGCALAVTLPGPLGASEGAHGVASPVALLPADPGPDLDVDVETGADPMPAPAVAPPAPRLPGPVVERIERAWSLGSPSLEARVARTRSAADESGIASLDPLGRALVFGSVDLGSAAERAEAAVVLAPDLPAAHAALASARLHAGSHAGALAAGLASVRAIFRSFDGSLWFAVTASVLLFLTLASGALAFLLARSIALAPLAAHDLGDHIEASMPAFSRMALLAALVLLPAALGEGAAGAALGLLVVALWKSRRAQQIALAGAALLFVAAIHPVADFAGSQIAAIGADPVVSAVVAAEGGAIDPVDAARLARNEPVAAEPRATDPLALYALAQWIRRSGDLPAADARFAALLAQDDADPIVLASAASTKIALGDPEAAVELYRRAIAIESSAFLWFNLSQAHGRAIDVEQHDRALAAAQSLDPLAVSELTSRLANSPGAIVADLPLSRGRLRARLASTDAAAAAAQLRASFAPGLLGRSGWIAAFGLVAAIALGVALQRRADTSMSCGECGALMCRHCGTARESSSAGGEPRCEECRRRRAEARSGSAWESRTGAAVDPVARVRTGLGCLLPGLAGRAAQVPGFGLVAMLAAAGTLVLGLGADSVVPDPATVGAAGAIAFGAASSACAVAYAAFVFLAFRLERRRRT